MGFRVMLGIFGSSPLLARNKLDKGTELRENLEFTRVLISSSPLRKIDQVLQIRVDGKHFPVRVLEEHPCCCRDHDYYESEEEDASDCRLEQIDFSDSPSPIDVANEIMEAQDEPLQPDTNPVACTLKIPQPNLDLIKHPSFHLRSHPSQM